MKANVPSNDRMQKLYELEQLRDSLRERQAQNTCSYVKIGDFTYGDPHISSWGEGTTLTIGKFCSIASNVQILLGGNHRTDWTTTYPFNALMPSYRYIKGHPSSNGNVVIGNDVWLASDVKIMSGVTIGDGAVIAANALVTTNVEPYSIYGGVPAKKIGSRFSNEVVKILLDMKWWDWSLEQLVDAIPLLQSEQFDRLAKYYRDVVCKTDD